MKELIEAEIVKRLDLGKWEILLPSGAHAEAGITAKVQSRRKKPHLEIGDKVIVGLVKDDWYSIRVKESKSLKWI